MRYISACSLNSADRLLPRLLEIAHSKFVGYTSMNPPFFGFLTESVLAKALLISSFRSHVISYQRTPRLLELFRLLSFHGKHVNSS